MLQELYNQDRFVLITHIPVKTLTFRIKGKEIILRGYFNEQKKTILWLTSNFYIKISSAYN